MMKIKEELCLKDMREMELLEKKYYDEEFITPANESLGWYQHNPKSIMALKDNSQIVGFMAFVPIKPSIYEKIQAGIFNDRTMTYRDIYSLEELYELKEVHFFLSCVAIELGYRKEGLKLLLKEYLKFFDELISKGIKVQHIITDNVTKEGVAFSRKFGLEEYTRTDHQSHIYWGKYDGFRKAVEEVIK